MYGDYDQALQYSNKIDEIFCYVECNLIPIYHIFYQTLAITGKLANESNEIKSQYYKQLQKKLAQLKFYAEGCADNFMGLYLLAQAEILCLKGKYTEALHLYNNAIEATRKNGFIQFEALSNELCGRCLLTIENQASAELAIKQACQLYIKWGAFAKVKTMAKQYPTVINASDIEEIMKLDSMGRPQENITIDLRSLLKASQSISGEISLNQLIKKLLDILTENIGAQRTILILENKNKLYVQGECTTDSSEPARILSSIPLENKT